MAFIYAWAFASDALYGQLMWIEHPNFPGGPVAYFFENTNIWIQVFGTLACMIADWLGEGLLVRNILEPVARCLMFPSCTAAG